MNKENVYTILLRKIRTNGEYIICIPQNIIKGEVINNELFCDEVENSYRFYYDEFGFYEPSEYCVSEVFTKKEIIGDDINLPFDKCKTNLFDAYRNQIIIVKCDYEGLTYIPINFDDVYNKLNQPIKNHVENKEELLVRFTRDALQEYISSGSEECYKFFKISLDMLNEIDKNEIDNLKQFTTNQTSIENLSQESVLNDEEEKLQMNQKDQKYFEENFKDVEESKTINIKEAYDVLTSRVIGQDKAIKTILTALKMDEYAKEANERNRCLIIGSTGSGKTLILQTLSKYLDIPLVIADSTQITAPGYVGANIQDVLYRLLEKANGNINKAENGIVCFDEIDKKGSEKNNDISHRAVLNDLLPFIDGTDYKINSKSGQDINFNTSKLTIFASGAFTNVINNCSLQRKAIGFNNEEENENIITAIEPEHLVKYGLMPDEFIGRFSNIVRLNKHTLKSLKDILIKSNNSPLSIKKRNFNNLNVNVKWDKGFIDAIAEKAFNLNEGGRSLTRALNEAMDDAFWEVLYNPDKYRTLFLSKETVSDSKKYILK